MIVTRTLQSDTPGGLLRVAEVAGQMRSDIWHRFGGLAMSRRRLPDIRKDVPSLYGLLDIDGAIRAETAKDCLNDIKMYREAAKALVRKAINRRADGDKDEAKRMYALLKSDAWTSDNFLHRQMRKHFKHGQVKSHNQFVVRSDKHSEQVIDGKLVIKIRIASKYGKDICLTTTSNGDGVDLRGKNLRVVVREGFAEVHYAYDKGPGRTAGEGILGVDKGYTEALVDSDGHFHGRRFGEVLAGFTKKVNETGKARGKLRALEKKHLAAGRAAKAGRIRAHNLGLKKAEKRKRRAHARLRTIAFKAAHAVVDKAEVVAAEDLTAVFNRSKSWGRGFNRRMGMWAKGVLAEALTSVTEQRSADLLLVNAAYTSQVSSLTGRLEGTRKGDRFTAVCGRVVHADVNAARNIRERIYDEDIGRYTPFRKVREILIGRSSGGVLPLNGLEFGAAYAARQPSADTITCSEMGSFK